VRFFFYGTLLDPEMRASVLGDESRPVLLEPSVLRGWERYFEAGVPWPMIRRRDGAAVEGALASGLSEAAGRLLDEYEGELYRREEVVVECGGERLAALVYVPALRER
jgi:gamma-glutamylcyclotransferase (GGCT)/AIG2-like uncharacterized protein YtfP